MNTKSVFARVSFQVLSLFAFALILFPQISFGFEELSEQEAELSEMFRARVTCSVNDNGFEEHRNGHRSCRECLSYHGGCTESCVAEQVECTAVGEDRNRRLRRVPVRDASRWVAQDQAMRLCSNRFANCRLESCRDMSETVSRRSCGRW